MGELTGSICLKKVEPRFIAQVEKKVDDAQVGLETVLFAENLVVGGASKWDSLLGWIASRRSIQSAAAFFIYSEVYAISVSIPSKRQTSRLNASLKSCTKRCFFS